MRPIRILVKLLLIVGALNWGLIALFHYDAVADLFGGPMMMGARVAYGLVGLAGLIAVLRLCCSCCGKKNGGCGCGSNCSCGGNCGGGCGCRKP